MPEAKIDANELVSSNFKWNEKHDGFVVESHEAIKAFSMAEIEALKKLKDEGKLKTLGAFGFIVERACESLFFSKTDIEAVRPVAKEDDDSTYFVQMLYFASKKLSENSVGLMLKTDVRKACSFIDAVSSQNNAYKQAALNSLPNLKNNQGTKFSLSGNDDAVVFNFIAEVVEEKFRLWVSWTINGSVKSKEETEMSTVRLLIGEAIAKDCINDMSFLSRSKGE